MKVFVDTNVVLDCLYNRKPFVDASKRVWDICEAGYAEGYISALSIANILYVLRKELDDEKSHQVIMALSKVFRIESLYGNDFIPALDLKFPDNEDALQCVAASRIHAEYIITRNEKDFCNSPIPVINPNEFYMN